MATKNFTTGKATELFPGQLEHEEVLIFVRRHWVPFLGWVAVTVILLLIPLVALLILRGIGIENLWQGQALTLLSVGIGTHLLLTGAVFLTGWIEHYLAVSILTTDRLVTIRQVGLFNRRVAELSLLRVQDVSAHIRGYLQSLLQFGDVSVETAGEVPNFVMKNVPRPHIIANTILMLHDRLALQTGQEYLANRPVRSQQSALQSSAVPMSKPPHDYDHSHFTEDLFTQAEETHEHLQAAHPVTPPVSPRPSPNRLPPKGRQEGYEEGELVDGESVSLH